MSLEELKKTAVCLNQDNRCDIPIPVFTWRDRVREDTASDSEFSAPADE
jgi:hypothetical protein